MNTVIEFKTVSVKLLLIETSSNCYFHFDESDRDRDEYEWKNNEYEERKIHVKFLLDI